MAPAGGELRDRLTTKTQMCDGSRGEDRCVFVIRALMFSVSDMLQECPSRPAKIPQVPDHRPDRPVIPQVGNMRRSVPVGSSLASQEQHE